MSLIDSFFFIRYWQNGRHTRLRILPSDFHSLNSIELTTSEKIEQYFCDLKENTKFSYEFNSYIREEERYGGAGKMEIAERQFQASSKTIINLIHSNYNFWDDSLALSLAIQMHLHLSGSLFLKKEDEISFYKRFYEDWLIYSKGIDGKIENLDRSRINNLLESYEGSYNRQREKIINLIKFIQNGQANGWQTQWKADCSDIAGLYDTNMPNDKYQVYSSLMHMTNNRLGIHISDESFVAFLIFKGLEECSRGKL